MAKIRLALVGGPHDWVGMRSDRAAAYESECLGTS